MPIFDSPDKVIVVPGNGGGGGGGGCLVVILVLVAIGVAIELLSGIDANQQANYVGNGIICYFDPSYSYCVMNDFAAGISGFERRSRDIAIAS